MTFSCLIRPGGGGPSILAGQPGNAAPATSPEHQRPIPIRCEPLWRAAADPLKQSVGRLIELLENQEPPRKRQRRANDSAIFHLAIECVACNLVAVSLGASDRPLAIPLANSASQKVSIFGKPARKVVDLMLGLGFITKVQGYPYRGPTTIQATPELRKYLPLASTTWNALRLAGHFETVVVKQRRYAADGSGTPAIKTARREMGPDWLRTMTDEMHTINAAILSAGIECSGTALAHISERPGAAMASLVTLHHRTLRRIFNGSYDEGGRLFGGFWQTMPRSDRFNHIRIAGECVAVVDYGQLFVRLAYAEAGTTPPPGDLYDISGRDASLPGWRHLRDARKKLVNALFFRDAPLAQWPGATLTAVSAIRSAFPIGTKPRDAIAAIKEKHASIAHLFEKGHGLRFMRTESDLIVAVTLALSRRGIVALPIHDAVAVRRSAANVAKKILSVEAKRVTGAYIPVDIQTGAA